MYNQSYDDYIRSVLGNQNANTQDYYQDCNSCNYDMQNPWNYNYNMQNDYDFENSQNRNSELEDCYPEIYKIVYPMVKKACQNMNGTVTKDEVDRMVDEIYSNIEGNNQISLNINLNNNIENLNSIQLENAMGNEANTVTTSQNRMFNGKKVVEEPKPPRATSSNTNNFGNENRQSDRNNGEKNDINNGQNENRGIQNDVRESRQFNRGLSDIIRILLLRELLGRPGRPGNRPPFPPSGRPPFPPPGRPPFPPPNRPGRPPYNRGFGDIYEY